MMLEPLWTDYLIYLLGVSITTFILYARSRPHLARPWKRVFRSKVALSAFLVLMSFVVIGVLDSVHLRLNNTDMDDPDSGKLLSALDLIMTPARTNIEKTYSAPFALQSYSKETIQHEDGSLSREYVPLKYAGAHLEHPENRARDVGAKLLYAFGSALLAIVILRILVNRYIKHQENSDHADGQVPWNTVYMALGIILFLVVGAALISPHYHILGTDKVGGDVFYQSVKSIRTGLVIGTLTTLIMLPFAIFLGVAAGYFGKWIDDLIQYMYTTLNSIPGVLLIAAAVLMMQVYMDTNPQLFDNESRADLRLLFLCVILGITSWTGLCRLLRAESLKLRELDYVQAAQSFGVGNMKILGRHIVPNVMHLVLITIVLDFSGLVLAEAFLTYVGVGVDPTMNSWGNMINQARLELAREPIVWWSVLSAFVFMFTLVLAANLFADAVRDAFDPRLRR